MRTRSFLAGLGLAAVLVAALAAWPAGAQYVTNFLGRTFTSSAPSGVNGFACKNAGCRVDFGPGAGDHIYGALGGLVTSGYLLVPADVESSAGRLKTGVGVAFTVGASLPTCTSAVEGEVRRLTGTGGTGTLTQTRFCACVSDGAASPVYSWRNVISGTAGNATTCNP